MSPQPQAQSRLIISACVIYNRVIGNQDTAAADMSDCKIHQISLNSSFSSSNKPGRVVVKYNALTKSLRRFIVHSTSDPRALFIAKMKHYNIRLKRIVLRVSSRLECTWPVVCNSMPSSRMPTSATERGNEISLCWMTFARVKASAPMARPKAVRIHSAVKATVLQLKAFTPVAVPMERLHIVSERLKASISDWSHCFYFCYSRAEEFKHILAQD